MFTFPAQYFYISDRSQDKRQPDSQLTVYVKST